MSLEGFDVAVVCAGPAGSAAALTPAREGVHLYTIYPELVCAAAEAVYHVDGNGKKKIFKELRSQAKGRIGLLTLIRDMISGARTF